METRKKQMCEPNRALLVVDVQPTFCEGGEIEVLGGNALAKKISDYIENNRNKYSLLVSTQDWHIDPAGHFSPTPDFLDTWPPHGVAGTPEAELHPEIAAIGFDMKIKKGQYEAAYSGFEGHTELGESLCEVLTRHQISQVDVVGIAISHCVKETAIDAKKNGFTVCVLEDLTIPVTKELGEKAVHEILEAGVKICTTQSNDSEQE